MADVTKDQVFGFIDNMTILQMSEFIKEFEERYGVTAAAPVAVELGRVVQQFAEGFDAPGRTFRLVGKDRPDRAVQIAPRAADS